MFAGVHGSRWFEEQNLGFVLGAGAVLDAARDDNAFSRAHLDDPIAKFDAKPTPPDEEELVFLLMPVPGKLALDLDEFDLLPVHRRDHLAPPPLVEQAELLIEIDLGRDEVASLLRLFPYSGSRGQKLSLGRMTIERVTCEPCEEVAPALCPGDTHGRAYPFGPAVAGVGLGRSGTDTRAGRGAAERSS